MRVFGLSFVMALAIPGCSLIPDSVSSRLDQLEKYYQTAQDLALKAQAGYEAGVAQVQEVRSATGVPEGKSFNWEEWIIIALSIIGSLLGINVARDRKYVAVALGKVKGTPVPPGKAT